MHFMVENINEERMMHHGIYQIARNRDRDSGICVKINSILIIISACVVTAFVSGMDMMTF